MITICRQYLKASFTVVAFIALTGTAQAQTESSPQTTGQPPEPPAADHAVKDKIATDTAAQDKAVYQRFASLLSELQAMSGHFEQVVLDGEGHQVQKTQGDFKVKRPGYFWWEVAPPYEQVVVGTPDSLKVYDPDLEQLTVHDKSSLAGSPAMLISGDITAIEQNYQIKLREKDGKQTFDLKHLVVKPDGFETLSITFTSSAKKGSSQLEAMQFSDKLGQSTQITFSSIDRNPGLDVSSFELKVPEGTDVIIDQ